MPVYTIYHRFPFTPKNRQHIAAELTKLHCNVTGTSPSAVKVFFIFLEQHSFFCGGETKDYYVRVVAQIRQGRTENQKVSILSGAFEIVQQILKKSWTLMGRRVKGLEDYEIQTQIVEIDDTTTVMTNGVLNT